MTLIVALTGATGLLASFILLRAGVDSMMVRYPLALVFAYLIFLLLLWLWLRTKPEDYLDVPDLSGLPGRGSGDVSIPFRGGGGDFGGGGASGSFDGPADAGVSIPSSSISDAAGSIVDADEVAIPIVAVALAIGFAVASLYVIYIAPILFAELMVDGALSYALYRHLRSEDSPHWLATACRRTVLPFGATAVFLAIVGAAMSAYAPGARSVGEVMHHTPAQR